MADCSNHCPLQNRNAGGERPQHTIEQFVNAFRISLPKQKRKPLLSANIAPPASPMTCLQKHVAKEPVHQQSLHKEPWLLSLTNR